MLMNKFSAISKLKVGNMQAIGIFKNTLKPFLDIGVHLIGEKNSDTNTAVVVDFFKVMWLSG